MLGLVECHSGTIYAGKPVAFTWQAERLLVARVLSEGLTPLARWFRVQVQDGRVFELTYAEAGAENSCGPEWRIHQI